MKLSTILIATLLSFSAILPSFTLAQENGNRLIVKENIEFGTVTEVQTQVALIYGLMNNKVGELAKQAIKEVKTERERELNDCIDIVTNSLSLSAFEEVVSNPDSYVKDQIKELSLNGYTEQTKNFCKENIDEVSELYAEYLDKILK